MLPNTYLACAPSKAENPFGNSFSSSLIIKGLQRINPNLVAPSPDLSNGFYPLKALGGTCLWWGDPKLDRKVCAFRLGEIPEFTQIDQNGALIARGWRSLFKKVISSGAATARQIEKEFKVVLDVDGEDGSCRQCRREGKLKPSNKGKRGLCNTHDYTVSQTERYKLLGQELKAALGNEFDEAIKRKQEEKYG